MPRKGYRQTEEHKAKIAAALRDRPKPTETRARIAAGMRRYRAEQLARGSGLTGRAEATVEHLR